MYRPSLGTRGETRRAAAEAETALVGRVRPWTRHSAEPCPLAPHVLVPRWVRAPDPRVPPKLAAIAEQEGAAQEGGLVEQREGVISGPEGALPDESNAPQEPPDGEKDMPERLGEKAAVHRLEDMPDKADTGAESVHNSPVLMEATPAEGTLDEVNQELSPHSQDHESASSPAGEVAVIDEAVRESATEVGTVVPNLDEETDVRPTEIQSKGSKAEASEGEGALEGAFAMDTTEIKETGHLSDPSISGPEATGDVSGSQADILTDNATTPVGELDGEQADMVENLDAVQPAIADGLFHSPGDPEPGTGPAAEIEVSSAVGSADEDTKQELDDNLPDSTREVDGGKEDLSVTFTEAEHVQDQRYESRMAESESGTGTGARLVEDEGLLGGMVGTKRPSETVEEGDFGFVQDKKLRAQLTPAQLELPPPSSADVEDESTGKSGRSEELLDASRKSEPGHPVEESDLGDPLNHMTGSANVEGEVVGTEETGNE